MNDDEKYLEAFVQDIPFDPADQKHREALKTRLLNAFPRDRLQPTARTVSMWRTIMKGSIPKLATAAAIVTAVLIGLNMVTVMPTGGVAWGQVLDNVRKAQSFAYRIKTKMVGLPNQGETLEMETEVAVDTRYGVRMVSSMRGQPYSTIYLSIPNQVSVTIIPNQKKYVRTRMTDAHFERMGQEHGDPRKLVEKFMAYDHAKLGRRTIDGTEVEGIECQDPRIAAGVLSGLAGQTVENVTGRLWANVENNLPVRLEIEAFTKDGRKAVEIVTDAYRWDIEMAPSAFEPDIPDDYELGADVEVSADVDTVIKGLRFFAKYAEGKYPSEISAMTMGRELRSAVKARLSPGEELSAQDREGLFALQVTVRFYAGLVMEDRAPAYYGDKITAAFDNAVLMRWRLDDGRYKVILANLTTKEVTAEALVELERPSLEQ